MQFFIITIMSFLSVVGFVEIIRKIQFWLRKPKNTRLYMGVVIESVEEAENSVRSMIQRIKWMDLDSEIEMFIVDKTKDPRVKLIIEKIISDFPNVSLL